ncbi:MAG: putative O-glycosylation ligase, exosortase A system-associated [Candidatus Binatia bacterium]
MRDPFVLLLTLLFSVMAISRPSAGVLAFVFYGIFGPHGWTWGIARTFPHSQMLAIATLGGFLFTKDRGALPRQREVILLALLWGVFFITTGIAFEPIDAVLKLKEMSKILLMVFLSLSLLNDEKKLHLLMRVITLTLGFYGLKGGIFAFRTAGNEVIYGPEDTFLTANNAIGLALAMNLPLLVYMAKIETNVYLKQLYRVMFAFSYPAIICTFSRGAWLGMVVSTGLLVLKSKRKFLVWTAVGLFVISSPAWLSMVASQRMAERYDSLANYEKDESAESRQWNMAFCARVGSLHPIFGAGFNYYSIEAYEAFYPEFLEKYPGKVWSCHSMWLTVWGEHGIVGTVLWMGLLASCFSGLRQIRKLAARDERVRWAVPYADMLQIAFWSFMVSGTFLDVAYFEVYYQLIGAVILLKERVRERLAEPQAQQDEISAIQYDVRRPVYARMTTRGTLVGRGHGV